MVDAIPDSVFTGALLLVAVAGSVALSLPLAAVAVFRYGKTRRGLHRRALLLSALSAIGQGLALAALGALFAAGIGDENAGEALVFLAVGGLVGGAVVAFVPSYLLILLGCKVVDWARPPAGRG